MTTQVFDKRLFLGAIMTLGTVVRARKRGLSRFSASFLLVGLFVPLSEVPADLVIRPDLPPKKNVMDTINVVVDGVSATIRVNIPAGATQADKAAEISRQLNMATDGNGNMLYMATQQRVIGNPNAREVVVKAKNPVSGAGSGAAFPLGGNASMERMDRLGFQTFALNTKATIDYEGNPVGPGTVFQATFGDDAFVISSDLTFSDLELHFGSMPTEGNLLEAMYDELINDYPTYFGNFDLVRDTNNNPLSITFDFPELSTNPFVENFSSDTGAVQTLALFASEVTVVPEPSTLILLGMSAAGFVPIICRHKHRQEREKRETGLN